MKYEHVVRDGQPAKALVAHCNDPDWLKAHQACAKQLAGGKYDPYARPGASWTIVEKEDALEEIELLHTLHHFELVIILDHIDCKRFGVENEELEIEKHCKYLAVAASLIQRTIDGVEVESYLLGWEKPFLTPEDFKD